jgi:hypothetical protein
MDYGPCEFSRIHVDAPTKDYTGLIKGIKEGSFWADHGKLLHDDEFSVQSKEDDVHNTLLPSEESSVSLLLPIMD